MAPVMLIFRMFWRIFFPAEKRCRGSHADIYFVTENKHQTAEGTAL
jgi:hypothetical protein